jgi:tRNA threonylcarbamoyladenosine biosynthesis protein TsaE
MAEISEIKNEEELGEFAEKVVKDFEGGEPTALTGELGSGKTTFTQALGKFLGVKEQIISPTFIILRSYKTEHPVIKTLHHLDLYRLETPDELHDIGLEELIDKESLVVVEWADRIKESLPEDCFWINFEYVSETDRKVTKS